MERWREARATAHAGTRTEARTGVRELLRCACAIACLAMCVGVTAALAEEPGPVPVVPAPAPPVWALIVHPANPTRSIGRSELERIYRRRQRYWPDKSPILSLNLPGGDPLRRAFTTDVLHDDDDGLATYWNREYFQGVAPPAVLKSSKAVRTFVAATPNAIGYVSREDVDPTVAAVEVDLGH